MVWCHVVWYGYDMVSCLPTCVVCVSKSSPSTPTTCYSLSCDCIVTSIEWQILYNNHRNWFVPSEHTQTTMNSEIIATLVKVISATTAGAESIDDRAVTRSDVIIYCFVRFAWSNRMSMPFRAALGVTMTNNTFGEKKNNRHLTNYVIFVVCECEKYVKA